MASIRDIAAEAGVSISTVSRVLNNPDYHCQDPGLRERIWKIAMRLNYTPNEAARNLRSAGGRSTQALKPGKTYLLHVLMTRTDANQSDPFFTELLHVVESEIHSSNCILSNVFYNTVLSNDRKCQNSNLEGILRDMYGASERSADGLIIIGKCYQGAIRLLRQHYRAVVSVNRNSTNYEVDEVLCDGRKVARLAMEHLIGLGHTQIAYVGAVHHEARYLGYQDVLAAHGIDLDPSLIYETEQTETQGYQVMERILADENDRPTAIYCANDITAVGMLKCLAGRKNLFYQPSIIASDDIEQAQFTKPMLTTVGLPKADMGRFALFLLLDRLNGRHTGIVRMELEGKLINRSSCHPVEDTNWSDWVI